MPWWGLEAGTPYICSISEHLLWFSLELGHARHVGMDKMDRLCQHEPKVGTV